LKELIENDSKQALTKPHLKNNGKTSTAKKLTKLANYYFLFTYLHYFFPTSPCKVT